MTITIRVADKKKGDLVQVLEYDNAITEIRKNIDAGHLIVDSFDRPIVDTKNILDGQEYKVHKLVGGG